VCLIKKKKGRRKLILIWKSLEVVETTNHNSAYKKEQIVFIFVEIHHIKKKNKGNKNQNHNLESILRE
jgi:hypothetical protein